MSPLAAGGHVGPLASANTHRGSILLEQARVLTHTRYDGEQYMLRLSAPGCAARAQPGSFVHLRCAERLPMRRPFSIMRADRASGWIELLYKVVGPGTRVLAAASPGQVLSLLGPIGRAFTPHEQRPHVLAIGGGVGIPPMVFLAERLLERSPAPWRPLVLMGSEVPFPFATQPATMAVDGMPEGVTACMPLLEARGVPSRLASLAGYPGCFGGYVTELARAWLQGLPGAQRQQVGMFACGPEPMLRAAARLAQQFGLPCQLALEEFMACGVGGCAGCTVLVHGPDGPAMKRVCVDGPVFEASSIYPPDGTPDALDALSRS